MEDESGKQRLLRLLRPMSGRHTEEGVIVRTESGQVLRGDDGDVALEDLAESKLADILCQIRGHSGW